jgi:hypothetical protein
LYVTGSSVCDIDYSLRNDKSYTTDDSITSLYNEIVSEYDKNDSNIDANLSHHKETSINDDEIKTNGSIDSVSKKPDLLNIKKIKNTSQDGDGNDANSMDKELLALLADMKKMKRRCKHVLDVTDKYCVLNNEMDLKLDLHKVEVADLNASLSKSPTTSPWSTRCSSACSSPSEAPSPFNPDNILPSEEDEVDGLTSSANRNVTTSLQLPASINDRGLFKITLDSFGEHLGVLIKTYTRRHS